MRMRLVFIIFCCRSLLFAVEDYPFIQKQEKEIVWKTMGQFTEKQVISFMRERENLVYQQLEPSFDPYNGSSTIPEICLKKNLPKKIFKNTKNEIYSLISIYSSEARIVGHCDDTKKIQKTQYLMIHCKKTNKMHIVKSFETQEKHWNLKPIVNCK